MTRSKVICTFFPLKSCSDMYNVYQEMNLLTHLSFVCLTKFFFALLWTWSWDHSPVLTIITILISASILSHAQDYLPKVKRDTSPPLCNLWVCLPHLPFGKYYLEFWRPALLLWRFQLRSWTILLESNGSILASNPGRSVSTRLGTDNHTSGYLSWLSREHN